jgi:diacylglycerol kinase family enzyme
MRPSPSARSNGPVHVVINETSGRKDGASLRERFAAIIGEAGRASTFHIIDESRTVDAVASEAAAAARIDEGVVVVAGGDGTLNAVANAVVPAGCPMGVVPGGTFNYFARAQGLPDDPEEALRAALSSYPVPVQVGRLEGHVNGRATSRVFLVSASLGLYPQLLEDREAWKQRFGRRRIVALFSGVATLLQSHRQLRLELRDESGVQRLRTLTLLAANNRLQVEQVGLGEPSAVGDGKLALVTVRPVGPLAMLGLLLRGAIGTLGDADAVQVRLTRRTAIRGWQGVWRRRLKVAIDGEVLYMAPPLVMEVEPRPLLLLKPLATQREDDRDAAAAAVSDTAWPQVPQVAATA